MKLNKYLLFALFLHTSLLWAGDFEDGEVAYDTKNYSLALERYKKATIKGNNEAAFKIGFMYNNGIGVAQDYAEARKWFKTALSLGSKWAAYDIGMQYKEGKGVTQDIVMAHMWINIAAISLEELKPIRANFENRMTLQQIAEAQKLARECQARNFKNCD